MKKILVILFVVISAAVLTSCYKPKHLQSNIGRVFGTYYSFNYYADENYQSDIDSLFSIIDSSLSTFNQNSQISLFNASEVGCNINPMFEEVYSSAHYVSQSTGGLFDITVAPLVNYWGFGFNPKDTSFVRSQSDIDSIKKFVGYDKLHLEIDKFLRKSDSRVQLDASAIAKGYACDVIADFLISKGVDRYMLDIGGEISTHGRNPNGEWWNIGVVKPVDDASQISNDIEFSVPLKNQSIATSGNYRQFYITKERKVTHTINPITGYPVNSKVLSASVISSKCIIADAYATAFIVAGDTTVIKNIIKASKYELEAYIIVDENGEHQIRHYSR